MLFMFLRQLFVTFFSTTIFPSLMIIQGYFDSYLPSTAYLGGVISE